MSQPRNTKTTVQRRAWEPPRLTELKISTHTNSRLNGGNASRPSPPPPPTAPSNKLGFAFEWALPLAYQETK